MFKFLARLFHLPHSTPDQSSLIAMLVANGQVVELRDAFCTMSFLGQTYRISLRAKDYGSTDDGLEVPNDRVASELRDFILLRRRAAVSEVMTKRFGELRTPTRKPRPSSVNVVPLQTRAARTRSPDDSYIAAAVVTTGYDSGSDSGSSSCDSGSSGGSCD